MSRTIDEIFNEIMDTRSSFSILPELEGASNYQDFLEDLSSDSKVANWVMEVYLLALVQKTLEDKIDTDNQTIIDMLNNVQVGTADWYRKQMLNFQYGDIIQIVNGVPAYYEEDEDKQIIEYCSVEEFATGVKVKIRGKDSDVLTVNQLNAATAYLDDIKFVGTVIDIVNQAADDIKVNMEIIYDPQINLDDYKTEVEDAITNYVANLPFDSKIYMNEIVDLIQDITGTIDPRPSGLYCKESTDSTYIEYEWIYNLVAGYGLVNSLDSTITYTVG